jgi:transposase
MAEGRCVKQADGCHCRCSRRRLCRERNLIERCFSRLKHFRHIATRYEKLAANFLAMVQLASMRPWLRAYESTA